MNILSFIFCIGLLQVTTGIIAHTENHSEGNEINEFFIREEFRDFIYSGYRDIEFIENSCLSLNVCFEETIDQNGFIVTIKNVPTELNDLQVNDNNTLILTTICGEIVIEQNKSENGYQVTAHKKIIFAEDQNAQLEHKAPNTWATSKQALLESATCKYDTENHVLIINVPFATE